MIFPKMETGHWVLLALAVLVTLKFRNPLLGAISKVPLVGGLLA